MKRNSYIESRNIDFKHFYIFLGELLKGCDNKEIVENFYVAESLEQLQLNIRDHRPSSDYFFKKLKNCADQSDNYIELEKYVVYMNILLGDQYRPLTLYKTKLLQLIKAHMRYLTSDEYCVIRHLVDFEELELSEIINLYQKGTRDKLYYYFICEIYLIEKHYEKALSILEMIPMEGLLLDYQDDLGRYLRRRQFKKRLQQVFSFKYQQQWS